MKKIIQLSEGELYHIVASHLGLRDDDTIQIVSDTNHSIVVSIDRKKESIE